MYSKVFINFLLVLLCISSCKKQGGNEFTINLSATNYTINIANQANISLIIKGVNPTDIYTLVVSDILTDNTNKMYYPNTNYTVSGGITYNFIYQPIQVASRKSIIFTITNKTNNLFIKDSVVLTILSANFSITSFVQNDPWYLGSNIHSMVDTANLSINIQPSGTTTTNFTAAFSLTNGTIKAILINKQVANPNQVNLNTGNNILQFVFNNDITSTKDTIVSAITKANYQTNMNKVPIDLSAPFITQFIDNQRFNTFINPASSTITDTLALSVMVNWQQYTPRIDTLQAIYTNGLSLFGVNTTQTGGGLIINLLPNNNISTLFNISYSGLNSYLNNGAMVYLILFSNKATPFVIRTKPFPITVNK